MDHEDSGHLESGNCTFQNAATASRHRDRLNEAISLLYIFRKRSKNACVSLATDLVDNENKSRQTTPDTCSCLNEFCSCQRNAEHHHNVESIDVDAMGH